MCRFFYIFIHSRIFKCLILIIVKKAPDSYINIKKNSGDLCLNKYSPLIIFAGIIFLK